MKARHLAISNRYSESEDYLTICVINDVTAIAVVADGMGGLSFGSIAATIAVESIVEYLKENINEVDSQQTLIEAFGYADKKIREKSIQLKSEMGTAVAAVLIIGKHAYVCNQGNVRVYLNTRTGNVQLTDDHVKEIGYGHRRLTRCLKGAGLRDDINITEHHLMAGSIISVCSDGFYKTVLEDWTKLSDEQISTILESPEDDCTLVEISIQ